MRVKIRAKLFAGFGVVLFLMGVVGVIGWRYITHLSAEFRSLYTNNLEAAVRLANAESALWQLRYGFPQFLVVDPEGKKKIVADEPKWYGVIDENLRAYAAGVHTPAEKQVLKEWEDVWTKYRQARPRWFELQ